MAMTEASEVEDGQCGGWRKRASEAGPCAHMVKVVRACRKKKKRRRDKKKGR